MPARRCEYEGCPIPEEPHHSHHEGRVIPNYSLIGRYDDVEEAARSWQRKFLALAAERAPELHPTHEIRNLPG